MGLRKSYNTEGDTDTLIHNRRDEYKSISSKGVKGKCAHKFFLMPILITPRSRYRALKLACKCTALHFTDATDCRHATKRILENDNRKLD